MLLLGLMVLLGSFHRTGPESKGLVELKISVHGNSHTELYNASGVTLKQLLEVKHNVSFAGRLKCLDGICDSGKYWWHLQVNSQPTQIGAEFFKIEPGDKIAVSLE